MTDPDRKSKNRTLDIVIKTGIGICLFFTVIIFFYGQFIAKNDLLYASESKPYDAVWSYTDPSGATKQYRKGDRFDINAPEDIRLSMTLPDEIADGSCLFINSGKDLDAYVDGQLRSSYKLTSSVFGKNVKGIWVPVTLQKADAGKELLIVRPDYPLDTFYVGQVYIGNRLGFAMHLINDNLLILFLGFSIITFGTVICVTCLLYRIRRRSDYPLWYLSLGVLGGAIWLILDNYTYPLFFRNYFIDGIAEYMVIMLVPFPFAAYTNSLLEGRYRKTYTTASLMILINFVVMCLLHFLDIADFDRTMPVSNIISGLVALYCFGVIVYDTFFKGHRENTFINIGFNIFVLLGIVEIIHLNLPVHTNDGVYVAVGLMILLVFAVSHEIKRISEMRAETIEAQKANQAKTTFLANMSHEIRTPINAILGMDELILREGEDPKIAEYAGNIKSAGTALLEIISDVLDFSKIEQGKMDIINAEYDTATLISSIITMIGVKADEKGLDFKKDISKELPARLIGDEKRLREVMINLLGNAVKYTPKGSVTLAVRCESIDDDHIVLLISVKDTGIGIKDEDRDRLFIQFERLDHNNTRSIEGTGLGLAIAANLIRMMDGTIECNSIYGSGTEFVVSIPQTVTDHTPIGDIGSHGSSSDDADADEALADLGDVSILVVDDSTMNLKVARGLLGVLGAKVSVCESGAKMLELIRQYKYDVILLDHMMPGMDGIEALAAAKSLEGNKNASTPYIALTANAIAGAREMYLDAGFSDYLSKPMKIDVLSKVISENLN